MGFFKSISKAIGGGAGGSILGAGIGFALGDPTGGGLTGALLGGSLGASLFGGDEQVEALKRAGRIEEAERLRVQQFQEFIISQTAGQREAGQQAIGQLQEEVARPGLGPLASRGLREGQVALQRNLAGLGFGDSSVAGLAQGEFASRIAEGDINRRIGILGGLAQGASAGLGTGLGALQLGGGLAGRRAQTAAGIGGVQAAGRQAFSSNLLQLGLLGQLGGFGQPQPTGGTLGGTQDLNAFGGPFTPPRIDFPRR